MVSHGNRIYFGPCAFSGCDRNAVSKGYCDKHYRRLLKHCTLDPSRHVAEGNAVDRFHQKYDRVPFSGCWIWIGGARPNSIGNLYGRHWKDSKESIGAHRFSWEIHRGPIPDGMMVCHHCDNTLCVNPEHLFIGYALDNMGDAKRKGRMCRLRGADRFWVSKLTKCQVDEIRASVGVSKAQLSRIYQVSQSVIGRVIRNESY